VTGKTGKPQANEVSSSAPLPLIVQALGAAHAAADRIVMERCLEALVDKWRAHPEARLGATIGALGRALESEDAASLRAMAKARRGIPQPDFMNAMARASLADRGAILDLLTGGSVKELRARAEALAPWSPDPRIIEAYLDWLADVPYGGPSMKPFWRVGFAAMLASPQPRTLEILDELIGWSPFSSVGGAMHEWLTSNLEATRRELASALERRPTHTADSEHYGGLKALFDSGVLSPAAKPDGGWPPALP